MNRITNGMSPEYMSSLVNVKPVTANLRSQNNLIVPKYSTITYGKNNFMYYAPFYWNTLPNDVKNEQTFYAFKHSLKNWTPNCKCGFCVLCNISNR